MARVELRGQAEQVRDQLPRVCACCGDTATGWKEKKFVWFPAWTYLLLPIGVAPYLVVMIVLRKFMNVRLPVCERHCYPWFWQYFTLAGFMVYLLVLPWFLIVLAAATEKTHGRGNPLGVVLLLGWFVGLLVMPFVVWFVRRRHIHPVVITQDSIILGGVSEEFADRMR
jgi:hypothetical protein